MNLSALSHPTFRRYIAANFVALNGLWVQRITIAWIAWDITGSAAFVGLVAFLAYVPTLITGPLFGVLIDRWSVQRANQITQFLFAATALTGAGLYWMGALSAPVLAGISLFIGVVTSAQHPVRMAFTPRLVPKENVSSVIVLISLNFNLARVLGPAIGGALISGLGVQAALLVSALSYAPMLLIISTLTLRPRRIKTQQSSLVADFVEGFRVIIHTPLILRAILITGIFSLAGRGALEILPTIADGVFSKGASGLGILTASAGAGAVVAAVLQTFGRGISSGKLPLKALIAAVIGPVIAILLGMSQNWTGTILAVAGLGFTGTLVGVTMQSAIQMQVDDHLRGRVMSLWIMIALGATAIGSLLIGGLVDLLGLSLTLQIVGGASAVAILGLVLRR